MESKGRGVLDRLVEPDDDSIFVAPRSANHRDKFCNSNFS
jgi:hypothetical protein